MKKNYQQKLTKNGLTLKQEKEILEAIEDAKKGRNVTKPMSVDEAIAYLRKK